MKNRNLILGSLFVAFVAFSCSDYVQDVVSPIGSVSDAELNTPQDITPFVVGLQTSFTQVYSEGSLNNGGLSDELFFSRDVVGATFIQYEQIDQAQVGSLVPGNNSVQNAWASLTRYRLLADTLVERALNKIVYVTADDSVQRATALFNGYMHGAIVRTMMADEYSLTADGDGGGVVQGNGPFVAAPELRVQAIALLDKAIPFASPSEAAWCNSLKARIYLYMGDYVNAKSAADAGMTPGTPPLQALHNSASRNEWYDAAGAGRSQFMADARFKAYVDSVPSEAGRIPLRQAAGRRNTYFQQNKYSTFESPINYITWQENHLMLAELAARNSDNVTALQLINEVRASHNVVDLTDAQVQSEFAGNYLDALYTERDKELCFTGRRAMDQLRFNKWHLDPATTWKHLPISQDERTGNPNF